VAMALAVSHFILKRLEIKHLWQSWKKKKVESGKETGILDLKNYILE
jgi:hypothetical protein